MAELKIVVTGGGSGGHITPVLAVAHELKSLRPDCTISYIIGRGDGLADIPAKDPSIDKLYRVRAGKFRRYHGEGWRQLLDLPTVFLNIRDAFYVLAGVWQSYWLLRKLRPQVIFIKGGFVGVPVGLAAAKLGIPFITHDSDVIPGLANRIIARWAAKHAVALPKELYDYPADKTVTVGVPISRKYQPLDNQAREALRHTLGLAAYPRLVFVTGGGLGAQRLNNAVIANAPQLLKAYPDLAIVHLAGRSQEAEVSKNYNDSIDPADRARVQVFGFVSNLYEYSGLADVVVTRAGGNSMAEFAAQAKACVVMPNPQLTGGHQTKNARALADLQAIVTVEEPDVAVDPSALGKAISALLDDPQQAAALGERLHGVAQPDAARKLADLLLAEVRSA